MHKARLAALGAAFVVSTAFALVLPAQAQEKITIGVSLAQDDNPFYIAMLRGIRARAQELGWEVATVSANEDKLKQINGVQDLIARGVKGILISPIDAVGVNAAYDAAAAAKICAALLESERGCETTVFDGQRLAMAADETQPVAGAKPPPTIKAVPYRRNAPKRVQKDDPPPKQESSTLSSWFGGSKR